MASEIATELAEQADRALTDAADVAVLRSMEAGTWPATTWDAMAALGLNGALVAEDAGGVGLGTKRFGGQLEGVSEPLGGDPHPVLLPDGRRLQSMGDRLPEAIQPSGNEPPGAFGHGFRHPISSSFRSTNSVELVGAQVFDPDPEGLEPAPVGKRRERTVAIGLLAPKRVDQPGETVLAAFVHLRTYGLERGNH